MRLPRRVLLYLCAGLLCLLVAALAVCALPARALAAPLADTPPPPTVYQLFVPVAVGFTAPVETPPAVPPEDPAREQQLAAARAAARQFAAQDLHMPVTALICYGDGAVESFPTIGKEVLYLNCYAPLSSGTRFAEITVDLATRERADRNALRQAEYDAYVAKYGKMDLDVYNWLQTAAPTATMTVGIWVVTHEDLMQVAIRRVLALYPEAQAAVDAGRQYWEVEDPALSEEIRQTYWRFLVEETAKATQPLVDWLKAQGAHVYTFDGLPSVVADLTPAQIRDVEKLEITGWIQWAGAPAEPA